MKFKKSPNLVTLTMSIVNVAHKAADLSPKSSDFYCLEAF